MKDILVRAGKTFIQASMAYLAIALQGGIDITNTEILKGIGIGALSSGISALMNVIIKALNKSK